MRAEGSLHNIHDKRSLRGACEVSLLLVVMLVSDVASFVASCDIVMLLVMFVVVRKCESLGVSTQHAR